MQTVVGLERLGTIARFRNDLEVALLVDDVRDAGTQQRVIVDEHHGRLFHPSTRFDRSGHAAIRVVYSGHAINQQSAPAAEGSTAPTPARPPSRCAAR